MSLWFKPFNQEAMPQNHIADYCRAKSELINHFNDRKIIINYFDS